MLSGATMGLYYITQGLGRGVLQCLMTHLISDYYTFSQRLRLIPMLSCKALGLYYNDLKRIGMLPGKNRAYSYQIILLIYLIMVLSWSDTFTLV
jgi:hypothetical protein